MYEKENFENFLNIASAQFEEILKKINYEKCLKIAELIFDAAKTGKRTHVTGIGKNSHLAAYAASMFSSTGTPAYFLDATEAVHGSSGQVCPGDIVIALSNSGETEELLRTVTALIHNQAVPVAICQNSSAPLAMLCHHSYEIGVTKEGGPFNKAPRLSITAQMTLLQAISILLQSMNGLSLRQYKTWHPAGALGRSIK